MTRRHDRESSSGFPRRNQEAHGYFGRGGAERPTSSPIPRAADWQKRLHQRGTPLMWGDKPWPRRKPARFHARVGDVLAGNIVLRISCRCGHSDVIDPEKLRRRFEPIERLKDLEQRFRCSQCGRYGHMSVEFPPA